MGVHKGGEYEPRFGAAVVVKLLDQVLRLLGEAHVTALLPGGNGRPAVQGRLAVGLWAYPAGEAITVEPVRGLVEGFSSGIGRSGRGIVADQLIVGAGDEHVCIGDVLLASPEGGVAGGTKIGAHRRHAVRVEPKHIGIEGFLSRPRGLRRPMERRIMSGVDRRPAGHAGDRGGVVALEVGPVLTEEVLAS